MDAATLHPERGDLTIADVMAHYGIDRPLARRRLAALVRAGTWEAVREVYDARVKRPVTAYRRVVK